MHSLQVTGGLTLVVESYLFDYIQENGIVNILAVRHGRMLQLKPELNDENDVDLEMEEPTVGSRVTHRCSHGSPLIQLLGDQKSFTRCRTAIETRAAGAGSSIVESQSTRPLLERGMDGIRSCDFRAPFHRSPQEACRLVDDEDNVGEELQLRVDLIGFSVVKTVASDQPSCLVYEPLCAVYDVQTGP
jgi:hypothetical protein